MKTYALLILTLLTALPLAAAPPVVDAASASDTASTLCATAPLETVWTSDIGALGVCIASCDDGTTRTCTGTSCSAVDSACNPDVTGYCWSNAEGYKYCPAPNCPPIETCPQGPTCEQLNGGTCKSSGTCYEPHFNCRAFTCGCIGGHYSCP